MAACLRPVLVCLRMSRLKTSQNSAYYSSGPSILKIPVVSLKSRTLTSRTQLFQNSHVVYARLPIRWNSTVTQGSNVLDDSYIPEPPPVPDMPDMPDLVESLNALGEPTFKSLGLGGWSPNGIVQQCLEMLHVDLGIPWWGAIVIGTCCLRLLMFPLVIKSQKNAATMHNHMPTIVRLQERFTESRRNGNALEAARSGHELMEYMKRNQVKPFRNFLVPLAQLPVFISVFVGVRQMASLPVDSLKTGGLFWFTDLSVADPFYALPLITMATFLLTIELGVDGVKAGTMTHTMKWVMRFMPVVILPVISGFPSAMLCYWFTSNAISLIQVLFLKIPAVRSTLKIEQLVAHDKSALPKKKGFIEGFQETWSNAKLAAAMEERQKVDAIKFREAGIGPIQKTYSYDPTKLASSKSSKSSSKHKS